MTEPIKPCPFPHDDDLPPPEVLRHATAGYRYAACECGATGPARSTVEEAVAAWNRRAPLAEPTDAEVEALTKVLIDYNGLPHDSIGKGIAMGKARAALAAFVAGKTGG